MTAARSWEERDRIRRWRRRIYRRLFVAVGATLMLVCYVNLLTDLWLSNIARIMAAVITLFLMVNLWWIVGVWRGWLRDGEREGGLANDE